MEKNLEEEKESYKKSELNENKKPLNNAHKIEQRYDNIQKGELKEEMKSDIKLQEEEKILKLEDAKEISEEDKDDFDVWLRKKLKNNKSKEGELKNNKRKTKINQDELPIKTAIENTYELIERIASVSNIIYCSTCENDITKATRYKCTIFAKFYICNECN